MDQLVLLIILAALLFASAFFSCSETALFSLPLTKIKAYKTSPDPKSRLIAKLLEKPRDLLVTIFMLNTLVNILIQNTTSSYVGQDSGWGLKVVLPFLLLLLVGEIIPKYIGLQRNVTFSHLTAPIINFLDNFLSPIRRATVVLTAPVSHALFFYLKKDTEISQDELKHVLKKSEEVGALHPDESELVWGWLSIQEATVKEVMRPREEMLFYDIHEPDTRLKHLFVDQECSRLPVCDGDLQNLIGILSAKTYFLHQNEDIRKFLTKPLYVPESLPAKALLKRLDKKNEEMAIVVDEYGAISGLITFEDLIEIIIGDITDKRDKGSLYTRSSSTEIITSGRLELADFNELFECDLKSKNNMITISGWLIEKIGTIPKSGAKCEYDGFIFHVLSADQTRIRRLYVRKIKAT